MEFIKDYEFESLPLIDRDYEYPIYKQRVDEMIEEELKKGFDFNYDTHFAELSAKTFIKSQLLKNDLERIEMKKPFKKILDSQSLLAEAPDKSLTNDVQAWKNSISNVKAQLMHQKNHFSNMEVFQDEIEYRWEEYNQYLDTVQGYFKSEVEKIQKQIRECNRSRQIMQDKIYPELVKLTNKRNTSIYSKLQCQMEIQKIKQLLWDKYQINFDEYQEQKQKEEDLNNQYQVSQTEMEYENIHVEGDEQGDKKRKSDTEVLPNKKRKS